MLHTKLHVNRPVGSGEYVLRFFTIYGRGGHLGHVTSIMSSDYHFLVPENPGSRSRNDLDLQYSNIFIYSIRCLLLLTFRSLAAIVSEKSTVSLLRIEKPKLPNLTLP